MTTKTSNVIPYQFITVCNEVAKVMFLHLFVILFTGGGAGDLPQCMLGYHPLGADTPPEPGTPPGADPPGSRHSHTQTPPEQTPPGTRHPSSGSRPPLADGYCCGRYASYWNAFLFEIEFGSVGILVPSVGYHY